MASLRTLDKRAQPIARAFLRFLASQGVQAVITSARRDQASQAKLYAAYKAGRSKFPAAPPGKSTHGIGIAFDLKLTPPLYRQAGEAWEAAGFTWGGRFNDDIHFDFRPRA
jgi:LAS superfamily LD-carboxypeptidase LdcB